MKIFRTLTIAVIVSLLMAPALVFAGSLYKANKFIKQKSYKLAVLETDDLTINAAKERQNPKAWIVRGEALIKQGQTQAGLAAYEKATNMNLSKYAKKLKEALLDASSTPPSQAEIVLATARKYFEAPFVVEIRNQLISEFSQKADNHLPSNLKIAKIYYRKIMELNPGKTKDIYYLVIAEAKAKSNKDCLPYYRYAASICKQNCEKANEAGNRLNAIAQELFQDNVFDENIEKYRVVASKFVKIPPLVRVYTPEGSLKEPYKFKFAQAGQRMDHWIASPENMDVMDTIIPTELKYKIYFRKAEIVVDISKGEKIPKKIMNDEMLFESTGPVTIYLLRKKTVI